MELRLATKHRLDVVDLSSLMPARRYYLALSRTGSFRRLIILTSVGKLGRQASYVSVLSFGDAIDLDRFVHTTPSEYADFPVTAGLPSQNGGSSGSVAHGGETSHGAKTRGIGFASLSALLLPIILALSEVWLTARS